MIPTLKYEVVFGPWVSRKLLSQTCMDGNEPSVLVSARTELIFFLVAGIVLCFGFSRKIMLITD